MTLNFDMYAVILAAVLVAYSAPGVYAAYALHKHANTAAFILHLIGGFIAMPVYVYQYITT